jgi:hypothetical protein
MQQDLRLDNMEDGIQISDQQLTRTLPGLRKDSVMCKRQTFRKCD